MSLCTTAKNTRAVLGASITSALLVVGAASAQTNEFDSPGDSVVDTAFEDVAILNGTNVGFVYDGSATGPGPTSTPSIPGVDLQTGSSLTLASKGSRYLRSARARPTNLRISSDRQHTWRERR